MKLLLKLIILLNFLEFIYGDPSQEQKRNIRDKQYQNMRKIQLSHKNLETYSFDAEYITNFIIQVPQNQQIKGTVTVYWRVDKLFVFSEYRPGQDFRMMVIEGDKTILDIIFYTHTGFQFMALQGNKYTIKFIRYGKIQKLISMNLQKLMPNDQKATKTDLSKTQEDTQRIVNQLQAKPKEIIYLQQPQPKQCFKQVNDICFIKKFKCWYQFQQFVFKLNKLKHQQHLIAFLLSYMGSSACCQVIPTTNVLQLSNTHDKYIKSFLKENLNIEQILNKNSIPLFDINGYTPKSEALGVYAGQIKNNRKNGVGIMLSKDGVFYQGEWKNDNKQGSGILIYPDGQYYYGDWLNNQPNGNGIYQGQNPYRKYAGDWVDGKQSGNGIQYYQDGSFYNGEFKAGFKHGKGKLIYKDGTYYQGTFFKNKIQGYGISSGHRHRYQGEWQDGKMHGSGKSQWLNQKGQLLAMYNGDYVNGLKHGFGQYKRGNKTYKGQWINGQVKNQALEIGDIYTSSILKKKREKQF